MGDALCHRGDGERNNDRANRAAGADVRNQSHGVIEQAAGCRGHNRTAAKAATEDKEVTLKVVEATAREFNRTVQGKVGVKDDLKVDLGLKVREKPLPLKPLIPTKLQVVGNDNNSNEVSWNPNGNKSGTTYEVFA